MITGEAGVIQQLQRTALAELRDIGTDAPFCLLDFPNHANVGDSAIWLGTTAYFREHRATQPSYVASLAAFSEAALRASVPEGPIVIHGGGNFGDLWPRHHGFREHLLERFPDRAIIQHDDMPAVYSTAGALLFPSYYESFGIPLVEAMACGCPVITSSAPACPEVVGDAALVVDPDDVEGLADAMLRVVREPGLVADLRERGLARARRFSWHDSAGRLLAELHRASGR